MSNLNHSKKAGTNGKEVSQPESDTTKNNTHLEETPKPENDLYVGKQLSGIVLSNHPFGSFIDLNTHIDGLVHVSDGGSNLPIGKTIQVKISELNNNKPRLHLVNRQAVENTGIREPENNERSDRTRRSRGRGNRTDSRRKKPYFEGDPRLDPSFQEGKQLSVLVVNNQPFGSFVKLNEHVTGFIHIAHGGDNLTIGATVLATIVEIDKDSAQVKLHLVDRELNGNDEVTE